MSVAAKLQELGITLPTPVAPVANYVPAVRTGNLLVISGQLCMGADGKLAPEHKGKLGAEVCGRNRLRRRAAVRHQRAGPGAGRVGSLEKITRCVRLGGFMNAVPTYAALPAVMNGASDLMVAVLGDKGRHARSTIGVAELPMDAVVEVEAMFEVE